MEAPKEMKFGTKVAQGMNTRTAQRNRTMLHSTMQNNCHNIIECCNNTYQGAPHVSDIYCSSTVSGMSKGQL